MSVKSITSIDDVYVELIKDDVNISDQYQYIHPKKTHNKYVNMSLGRCWFNCLLPDEYTKLINIPINKKELYRILNEIYDLLPVEKATSILSNINLHAFKLSSIIPQTFSVDSTIVPDDIKESKNKLLTSDTDPSEYNTILLEKSKELLNSKNIKDSGVYNIIQSGAKLSPMDFGVLTLSKGTVIDIEQNMLGPITSGLIEGYSPIEYYEDAASARRTLHIRAVGTADPGTLAREVTYANCNTNIASNDCKTKKYLELFIKDTMVEQLIGRYMIDTTSNTVIEINETTDIINKTISLRSPLYCKDKNGICKICYGKLYDKINSKQIGVIAGAVINAAGVEGYAMKARHQSIQVQIKKIDFTKDIMHF
jgi:DNA-directed RNA polymerase subunit beta'